MTGPTSLAVAWLALGPFAAQPPVDRFPSPEQTRAELEALCARVRSSDNPFFGEQALDRLGQRLAAPSLAPGARLEARLELAWNLVRLGRHGEALSELERVLAELDAVGDAPADLRRSTLALMALAHLQLAEDRNCIALHNEASCILPIREQAVHADAEHARRAGDLFLQALELRPDDLPSRWLLNLARMLSGDYPGGVPEELRVPAGMLQPPPGTEDLPTFFDLAPRLGLDVLDLAGGAVVDDFDGDGRLDLVSSTWDPCGPMRAFRNDGRGGFEEVTAAWGLDAQLGGLNLVHADYDGDGRLDLLVLRGGWFGRDGRMRNSLLRNDLARDAGRFVDVTASAGLAYPAYPTQTAAWADYDGDGDLDLFVGNESEDAVIDPWRARSPNGPRVYPSQLFRNDGDGAFADVARAAGVDRAGFAKGVAWGDYDDDGDPDLYVSTLGRNRLYRNQGGTFVEVAEELGVTGGDRRTFATWFFDFDNDGDLDLFVASYNVPPDPVAAHYLGVPPPQGVAADSHPLLFRNEGEGRFTDVSAEVGFGAPILAMGANHADLDGDGWLDLYLGTGQPDFSAIFPNVLYRNVKGERFVDATFATGLGHLQKGHAVAFGDVDGDGDVDLYEQLGGAYPYDTYGNAFYPNPGLGHRWIVLRFRGSGANPFALGARVRVDLETANGERRSIHRLVGSGGSFGGSSLQAEIGLGDAARIVALEVRWPGAGEPARAADLALDRYYLVDQPAGTVDEMPFEAVPFRQRAPREGHHPQADRR